MYGIEIPETVMASAAGIRLLTLDVDGVFTDGSLYFSSAGESLKAFSTLDGLGVKLAMGAGIEIAIITGRQSDMVSIRAANLGIKHVVQGCEEKLDAAIGIADTLGLSLDQVAHVGDDLPDLPLMNRAALGITVPNAHPFMAQHADYCTRSSGGRGAVREACDLLLEAQGKLASTLANYV